MVQARSYNMHFMILGAILVIVLLPLTFYMGLNSSFDGGRSAAIPGLLTGLSLISFGFTVYNGLASVVNNHLHGSIRHEIMVQTMLLREDNPGDISKRSVDELDKDKEAIFEDVKVLDKLFSE